MERADGVADLVFGLIFSMILQALQKRGVVIKDADGTLHVQRLALRAAIAATAVPGITGHFKCDLNGDCTDPKIGIFRVTRQDYQAMELPLDPVWYPGGPDYRVP